jgi:hypothetical protein
VTDLLVSFAAAGGAPPASQELVRVFRDGRVRALAGTAWPGLGPVDEAGAYAFELDAGALAELERLAGAPGLAAPEEPRRPGSGSFSVRLGEEALRWDPFSTPSEPLAALAARLQALLVEARSHPLAAVRLQVRATAGGLAFTFTGLGSAPLSLTVASLRARIVEVESEPSEPPPLAWVRESVALDVDPTGPTELPPGETLTLEGATSAPQGRLRVDGFARVALDLAAVGEAELEATLGAGRRPSETS